MRGDTRFKRIYCGKCVAEINPVSCSSVSMLVQCLVLICMVCISIAEIITLLRMDLVL